MTLTEKEKNVLKKTRLRNLKRKFAKITQHAEMTEEAIEIKCEIDSLEREIKS